jgi:histone H3/H4
MTDPPASAELERIIKAAEVELRQTNPGLFSPEGFQRLTERINEFIGDLTVESVRIAKRHQSDSVSTLIKRVNISRLGKLEGGKEFSADLVELFWVLA